MASWLTCALHGLMQHIIKVVVVCVLQTLEPVVCMVWMSFAFRWRLPPLTSACLVGTSAGMAVFTHLPEDVMVGLSAIYWKRLAIDS